MGRNRKGKRMTERYNYIDSNKAHEMRCVHFIGDYTSCSGPTCMGWIAELDETGKPTGRGRCGMVYPVLTTCTCSIAGE